MDGRSEPSADATRDVGLAAAAAVSLFRCEPSDPSRCGTGKRRPALNSVWHFSRMLPVAGCWPSRANRGPVGHVSGYRYLGRPPAEEEGVASYIPAPKELAGFPCLKRGRPKTRAAGGGGLRKRWVDNEGAIYEWDGRHGTVEKYSRTGKHLGEFDPSSGEQLKPPDPARTVEP